MIVQILPRYEWSTFRILIEELNSDSKFVKSEWYTTGLFIFGGRIDNKINKWSSFRSTFAEKSDTVSFLVQDQCSVVGEDEMRSMVII